MNHQSSPEPIQPKSPESKPENSSQAAVPDFEVVIGIDRSDAKIDICRRERDGSKSASQISTAPEQLHKWMSALIEEHPESGAIAVAFEQPSRSMLAFLGAYHGQITIYALNPATPAKFREAFRTSRCKDDVTDAETIADLVAHHSTLLRPWHPQGELSRRLEQLTRARRQAVDERTRLTNQLTDTLKSHFPQALQILGDDLWRPIVTAFLTKWPTLQDAQKSREQTLRNFYYANRCRRMDTVEKRLAVIKDGVALSDDPAILECARIKVRMLAKQIEGYTRAVANFDAAIAEAFAEHPDAEIFSSLPMAAAVLAPRLLAAFGDRRDQIGDAKELQCISGVAPVTKQSGKSKIIHRRYRCSKFLRQSFVEWAGLSIQLSRWALAYYESQIAKGKKHHTAVRALAYKWQRILFRCWQSGETYDEERYIKALKRAGSPLIARMKPIENEETPAPATG
ncbi:MAG TPA: IS110 family transposase [Candidatus Latescibacteria bacterium]|jgi:transposase|nr:IS110 family transposase [Candidatus Latescibacterota bacterium]